MSSWEPREVESPCCKETQHVEIAKTLNLVRSPKLRDVILAGDLHVVGCGVCNKMFYVETMFTVVDVSSDEYYLVVPLSELERWPELEGLAQESFIVPLSENPHVRPLADRAHIRVVCGLGALREKILLRRLGLDDVIVELVKLERIAASPKGTPLEGRLIVDGAELATLRLRAHGQPDVAFPMTRYNELCARRAELSELYPGLFAGVFVSYERLISESRVPASKPDQARGT